MSRRRNDNQVRGPNSALTQFLREQGIDANEIRQRWERRQETDASETPETAAEGAPDEEQDEELQIRIAARRKRRAAKRDEEEYTDSDENTESDEKFTKSRRKVIGDEESCSCGTVFVVDVDSLLEKGSYLCGECSKRTRKQQQERRQQQLVARKKRKQVAQALLDKQEVRFPSLQDLCIKTVSANISLVEVFGDIGSTNLRKISKTLCRNRSLNDKTLQLFIENAGNEVEFWDCSQVSMGGYTQLVAFSSNLTSIKLHMCGQLHNDNLMQMAEKLKLEYVELDGPFLVNESTWTQFFKMTKLRGFKVSNTHRFPPSCLQQLVEHPLQELKLSRLDALNDYSSLYALQGLKSLEITYPSNEDFITDDLIVGLLSQSSLHTLKLDGCSALTDAFLINGLKPYGHQLHTLSLELCDQLTDDGLVYCFNEWENPGLQYLSLKRCWNVTDVGITEVLLHSGATLVELNLNSLRKLTLETFSIMDCPLLTTLDAGFIHCMDDVIVKLIGDTNKQLKLLEVYGNNKVTAACEIRDGLTVVGRQSDSI